MTRALQIHCLAKHSENYVKNLLSSTKPFTLLNDDRRDDAKKSSDAGTIRASTTTKVCEKENRRKIVWSDEDSNSGRTKERSRCSPYRWRKSNDERRSENRCDAFRNENIYNSNRNKRRRDTDDENAQKHSKANEKSKAMLNDSVRDSERRLSDKFSPLAAKLIRDKYFIGKHPSVLKVDLARCRRRLERTPYFPMKVHGVRHLSEVTIYHNRGIDDMLKNLTSKTTKLFRQCEPTQFVDLASTSAAPIGKNSPRFQRRQRLQSTYESSVRPDSPTSNWVMRNNKSYKFRGRVYDYRLQKSQIADENVLQNVIHLFCMSSMAGEIARTKFEMIVRRDDLEKAPSTSNVNVQSLLACFNHRKGNNRIQVGN